MPGPRLAQTLTRPLYSTLALALALANFFERLELAWKPLACFGIAKILQGDSQVLLENHSLKLGKGGKLAELSLKPGTVEVLGSFCTLNLPT